MSRQAETLRRMRSDDNTVALDIPRRRLVAVTGGKGGVGKSTMAVNLAVSWGCRGARTVALDADFGMADLNLLLGLAPEKTLQDLLAGCPVEDVLVPAHGIHLLPALNGSYSLANMGATERGVLFEVVNDLTDRFDTVVIDTPAGIGANAVALAALAAQIVVVVTPEPLSLADAYACLKVLVTRAGVRHAFVLPNNVRSPSQADEVFGRLATLVDRFLAVELSRLPAVPHDVMVAASASEGVPLVLQAPDSPAARAIMQAARRIDALSPASPRSIPAGPTTGAP